MIGRLWGWLTGAAPAGPPPSPPDPGLVDELVNDAMLLARYGRYAGVLVDGALIKALADVERSPDRSVGSDAVVRLHGLMSDVTRQIPFETLAELKGGWRPYRFAEKGPRRRTIYVILISIVLMSVTGKLTYFYNKGVSIAQELNTLQSAESRPTFYRLVRDMVQAYDQADALLRSARSEDGQGQVAEQVALARNAYFSIEGDLWALSERVAIASASANQYLTNDAAFPLWGMRKAPCAVMHARSWVQGGTEGWSPANRSWFQRHCAAPAAAQAAAGGAGAGASPASQPSLSDCGAERDSVIAVSQDGEAPRIGSFAEYRTYVERTATQFFCDGLISFPPRQFPPTSVQAGYLSRTITPYALWYLPALYGMMGATLYFMRLILDPLRPDPSIWRLVHRVILGALAGIVLTWFFTPDSRLGTQIEDVGFTLFTLAFLFGFSLDVFFAILDEVVSVTVGSIRRFSQGSQAGPVRALPRQS